MTETWTKYEEDGVYKFTVNDGVSIRTVNKGEHQFRIERLESTVMGLENEISGLEEDIVNYDLLCSGIEVEGITLVDTTVSG